MGRCGPCLPRAHVDTPCLPSLHAFCLKAQLILDFAWQVRRIAFSDDGHALLGGGEESLKVWGWEPVRCFEQVDVRWSRLADMGVGPNQQLVAGSIREAVVAIWNIDLAAMKPFTTADGAADTSAATARGEGVGPCSPVHACGVPSLERAARSGPRAWSASSAAPFASPDDLPPEQLDAMQDAKAPVSADAEVVSVQWTGRPDSYPSVPAGINDMPRAGCASDEVTASCARLHIADFRARISAVRTQSKAGNASPSATDSAVGLHCPDNHPAVGIVAEASRIESAEQRSIGTSIGKSLSRPSAASARPPPPTASPPPTAPGTSAPSDGLVQADKASGTLLRAALPAHRQAGHAADAHACLPQQSTGLASCSMQNSEEHITALLSTNVHRAQLSSRLVALRSLSELWAAGDVRKVCRTCTNSSTRVLSMLSCLSSDAAAAL